MASIWASSWQNQKLAHFRKCTVVFSCSMKPVDACCSGTLVFGFQRNAFGSHFAGKISCIWQPQAVALGDQPQKTRNQDANRIAAESLKLRQVALGKHGQQQHHPSSSSGKVNSCHSTQIAVRCSTVLSAPSCVHADASSSYMNMSCLNCVKNTLS